MINALFAADQFGGIGLGGSLPWPHQPSDMRRFYELTQGHVVVMGRRTWDDPKLPKPMVGRTVYVVTNRPIYQAGTIRGDNIAQQVIDLEARHPDQTIWVVGGADIIAQCEGIFDRLYLTHIKGSYKIDTRVNLKGLLSPCRFRYASAAPGDDCTFVEYEPLFNRPKASTA